MTSAPPLVDIRNHVDGIWRPGSGTDVVDVVNPVTGQIISTFHSSNAVDVDDAVSAARRSAPAWAALTPSGRIATLHRLADAVARHLDELRDLEILDTGKPITAASTEEFPLILDSIRYFLGASRSLTTQTAGQYVPV